jgi:hypothetical protein
MECAADYGAIDYGAIKIHVECLLLLVSVAEKKLWSAINYLYRGHTKFSSAPPSMAGRTLCYSCK